MPELDPRLADRSNEELEALLETAQPDGTITMPTPELVPEAGPVEAEAPVEEVAAPEEAAPVEQPEEQAAPEPEPNVEDETWRKRYEKAQAHAARLAGKLGYAEQRLKAMSGQAPADSVPADDTSDAMYGDGDASVLAIQLEELRLAREEDQRRLALLEDQTDARLRAQADARAAERARQLFVAVDDDVKNEVLQAHADEIREIEQVSDPERRGALAMEIVHRMSSEANIFQSNRNAERAQVQRTAATADLARAKKAQAPSGSGGVPSPPPAPKSYADMSVSEADAWLKENVR